MTVSPTASRALSVLLQCLGVLLWRAAAAAAALSAIGAIGACVSVCWCAGAHDMCCDTA